MLRPIALLFAAVFLAGCDSNDDGDASSALFGITVEDASGAPVSGLSLLMEYALISEGSGDRSGRPVELTFFEVFLEDGTFYGQWETSVEEGVARFVLEAGADEGAFADVAETDPLGPGERYEVEFQGDYEVFRLRIEDTDGSVDFSDIVEYIETSEENPTLPGSISFSSGYPNPFWDTMYIRFALPAAEQVTIDIVDLDGRVVEVLFDEVSAAGSYQKLAWEADPALMGGFYNARLTVEDTTLARTVVYAGPDYDPDLFRPQVVTPLGETDEAGRFATDNRAHFPQLYDGLESDYRGQNNEYLGELRPSSDIVLILRDGAGREQRYERMLSNASNSFTLTWNP